MKEYIVGSTVSFVVPVGVTNVLIVHEWGDIVESYVEVVAGQTHSLYVDSLGVYQIYWVNAFTTNLNNLAFQPSDPVQKPVTIITGSSIVTSFSSLTSSYGTATATLVSTDQFNVMQPLVTSLEFFNDIPAIDTSGNEDNFSYVEKLVRLYIERYTQQRFGPFINKTLQVQGQSGNSLSLDYPILSLRAITDSYGNNISSEVQVSTTSPYFVTHQSSNFFLNEGSDSYGSVDRKRDISYRRSNYFSDKYYFLITGDFGYYYVPQDVTEAAKLIIQDTYSGAQDLRRAGIQQAQLGDYSYALNKSGDGTTGNLLADQLLSPYININIGLA